MKLLESAVFSLLLVYLKTDFLCARSPPSSSQQHPFIANNFVAEAMKGFNLVKMSNYLVDFMQLNGMQMITKEQPHTTPDNFSNHLSLSWPIMALPSPYPKNLFELAKELQKPIAEIHFRGSLDYEFLKKAFEGIDEKSDYFVAEIVKIMHFVQAEGRRQCGVTFILQRSDYLTHKEAGKPAVLKQIEVSNHGASSAGAMHLGTVVHQRMLKKIQMSLDQVPEWLEKKVVEKSNSVHGQANALYKAWKIYRDTKNDPKAIILLIYSTKRRAHSHYEQLLYLQFELENIAWPNGDRPHVEQMTIEECTKKLHLNPTTYDLHIHDPEDPFLNDPEDTFVQGKRVAIVKWQDHFLTSHISTPEQWKLRLDVERSNAIVCPNVFTYLMGTKIVQFELTKPNVLEKFLPGEGRKKLLKKLRSTFIQMWALGQEDNRIIEWAIKNPGDYVLKDNREGGKGKFFDEELVEKLSELRGKVREKNAYILQKRIKPFTVKNAIIPTPPTPETDIEMRDVDSEVSIWGSVVAKGFDPEKHEIENNVDGYGVRTKWESEPMVIVSSSQEGAGGDSFVLFDQDQFKW